MKLKVQMGGRGAFRAELVWVACRYQQTRRTFCVFVGVGRRGEGGSSLGAGVGR